MGYRPHTSGPTPVHLSNAQAARYAHPGQDHGRLLGVAERARFIGGPFDGQIPEAGAIAVSAETSEPVPPAFADRWLVGHQREQEDLKVQERLRTFYVRQDYASAGKRSETVYVWAAEYRGWREREDEKTP